MTMIQFAPKPHQGGLSCPLTSKFKLAPLVSILIATGFVARQ